MLKFAIASSVAALSLTLLAAAQDRVQQKPTSDLRGHRTAIVRLAFLSTENQLVSASIDSIKVWNYVERKSLRDLAPRGRSADQTSALTAGSRSMQDMSVASDGALVAEAVMEAPLNGVIRLWNPATGVLERTLFENQRSVRSAQFLPNSKRLAVAVRDDKGDQRITVLNAETGKLEFELRDDKLAANLLEISPDGKLLAGAAANRIQVWDLETRKIKYNLPTYQRPVTALTFSREGGWLASAAEDEPVRIWDLQYGILYKEIDHKQDRVLSLAFSNSGKLLLTGGKDTTIKIWQPATLKLARTLWGHRDAVTALAVRADGALFAAGSKDTTVTLWELNEKDLVEVAEKEAAKDK